ncbi:MAG: hypothetical protein JSR90_01715 [Proteobacteria bacterium]|nr:hypothetical protein [Pseudomonadota bacterium]
MRPWSLFGVLLLLPAIALAQSAGEVERCFQNPSGCATGGGGGAPVQAAPRAAAPDYASVLKSPEAERRKIQESLRTLDKYNGPIDGDLQSKASEEAIASWQKGHGYAAVGKLTPTEAATLNSEAAKAPIKRINPSTATASTQTPPPSNADLLKALQARLAERRKAAEPKAEAAVQSLLRDLKAYVAADGKGVAGEQFPAFAKWYADNKAAGRSVGDITPAVEDYGEAKPGDAVAAEVTFQTKQGDAAYPQCVMFAWIEGKPRKEPQAFSCDDVAGLEKWKTDRALRSAWH